MAEQSLADTFVDTLADRAACAPADSVTAPAAGPVVGPTECLEDWVLRATTDDFSARNWGAVREGLERARRQLELGGVRHSWIDPYIAIAEQEGKRAMHAAAPTTAAQLGDAETALRKVLGVVQRYLPPDGPSAHDAMTEITAIVDPWPLDTSAEAVGSVTIELSDDQISLMAHNDDPGDWNELSFRDCWIEGYKTGARAAVDAALAQKEGTSHG